MSPEVTVVTAVRNGARYLPRVIASIRAQTFTDWEYVIIDDASDDTSVSIVEDAARTDARIRLLRRTDQGGPYVAANDALRDARGRYIVRIDADDEALPERIERQVAYLGTTGLRACACFFRRRTNDDRLTSEIGRVTSGVHALKWRLCVRFGLAHSTVCFEREAFEEIGLYNELFASQDLRMWCDFARRDWVGILPEALVVHRRPGDITSSDPKVQEQLVMDVLFDHINAVSPEPWSADEVLALRPRWTGHPMKRRLEVLDRWVRLWQSDATLTSEERRELSRLERHVYWEMTKQALRWEGPSPGNLRTILRTGPGHVFP